MVSKSSDYNFNSLLVTKCFKSHSHDILQFLTRKDIDNLKLVNKAFLDICDCHALFSNSIRQLGDLFKMNVDIDTPNAQKKSKFRERFNFNKSINDMYKGNETISTRIYSGRSRISLSSDSIL